MNDKVLSYIGLATKAGKAASGEFSTEKAIKSKRARLVVVAEDASDNTRKKFIDSCTFYHVPIIVTATKEELGSSTGKAMRASLAILDAGLAKAIMNVYPALEGNVSERQEVTDRNGKAEE